MTPAPCEVAAYYFPGYHTDPRTALWHGEGWTEWDLVRAARPRFEGHRQPVEPAWGFFDESDPRWATREIDLASQHGITCFLYDWYWYEDGPFLNGALDRGFLGAHNNSRLKFALMWANHDWLDIHPAKYVNRPSTLVSGAISPDAFEAMADRVIRQYLPRPNYLRLGGLAYFSIYETASFVKSMGGREQAASALAGFREKVKRAGLAGLHINGVAFGLSVLPSEDRPDDLEAEVAGLGLDSVTSYVWAHHYNPNAAGFPRGSYADAAEANYSVWESYRKMLSAPYFPNVTMGWDPSPRTVQTDRFDPRGYPFTSVLSGNSPQAFREALVRARSFVEDASAPGAPRMVTLNAWNEWTEGSYLLPDSVNGTAYLEAVRDVIGRRSRRPGAWGEPGRD